jgi:glycosyltransferase involved in cell wall biosynthesis
MRPYTLIAGDFVATGGMDRANLALATYLARRDVRLRLVAYRVAEELLAFPNVRFVRVPKPMNAYMLGEPLLDGVGRLWALRTRAEGGQVVVNGGNCRVPAANWVHYVHGAYATEGTGSMLRRLKEKVSHRLYLRGERRALRLARVIIANSERTKEDLVAATGAPPERVHVIYYGVDPEKFRPRKPEERRAARVGLGWPEGRKVALFVGALGDRRKGFDTVWAWEREAHRRGWGERIQFLGFREDVPELMAAADLLISPTRYEAYGLGVHEALCTGVPALVSRTAGVAERYPAELRGLLMDEPNDVDELVQRLERWRADEAELAPHRLKLAERLRSQTWEGMAAAIVELLERERREAHLLRKTGDADPIGVWEASGNKRTPAV